MFRGRRATILPGRVGREFLEGEPTLDQEADQRPAHRSPVQESPVPGDLGRVIAEGVDGHAMILVR